MKFLKKLFNLPYPGLHHVEDLEKHDCLAEVAVDGNKRWVAARPLGWPSLKSRVCLAWGVFTGKYDALKWEQQ